MKSVQKQCIENSFFCGNNISSDVSNLDQASCRQLTIMCFWMYYFISPMGPRVITKCDSEYKNETILIVSFWGTSAECMKDQSTLPSLS